MGTDICIWIEAKIDGKWSLIQDESNQLYTGRNYDLYGLLADARGRVPCPFRPKGFPNDMGRHTQVSIGAWLHLFYSHESYMTLDELIHASHVWDAMGKKKTTFFDDVLPYLQALKHRLGLDGASVRIIFLFW